MKPTFAPCWCCRGTGVEKTFQDIKPKLTYRTHFHNEIASIGNVTIHIYAKASGGYIATLNELPLPNCPVYSSSDAAKLAAERAVLEMAKVIVEILG